MEKLLVLSILKHYRQQLRMRLLQTQLQNRWFLEIVMMQQTMLMVKDCPITCGIKGIRIVKVTPMIMHRNVRL